MIKFLEHQRKNLIWLNLQLGTWYIWWLEIQLLYLFLYDNFCVLNIIVLKRWSKNLFLMTYICPTTALDYICTYTIVGLIHCWSWFFDSKSNNCLDIHRSGKNGWRMLAIRSYRIWNYSNEFKKHWIQVRETS